MNHHIISWKSRKQATVSLSSTEAEYKALADSCKETTWLTNLINEVIPDPIDHIPLILVDNKGAMDLAFSQISQNGFRTKHMDIRLHFVRDLIQEKKIRLQYIRTQDNQADFLTKPVGRSRIVKSLSMFTALSSPAPRLNAHSTGGCQDSNLDNILRSKHHGK